MISPEELNQQATEIYNAVTARTDLPLEAVTTAIDAASNAIDAAGEFAKPRPDWNAIQECIDRGLAHLHGIHPKLTFATLTAFGKLYFSKHLNAVSLAYAGSQVAHYRVVVLQACKADVDISLGISKLVQQTKDNVQIFRSMTKSISDVVNTLEQVKDDNEETKLDQEHPAS